MSLRDHTMAKMHVRGGKLTVTLPEEIREEFDALDGEEIDIRAENGRIVLIPKEETAERHLEIDAALAEALEDERAGKMSPAFSSVEEWHAWLKTPEGKNFSKK